MFDQFIDHMNIYIFQLPFWLKIQFVITHFRLCLGLLGLGDHCRSSFQIAMAGFPPNALSNQQRILEARFPPTSSAGDDDGRSTTGSISSWINVNGEEEEDDGLELPPAVLQDGSHP